MTSRTAQRRDGARRRPRHPLPERDHDVGPRCDCRHAGRRCAEPAGHRVTAVCMAVGCTAAAHVSLLCTTCTDTWLRNAARDPTWPELRVMPL